MAYLLPFIIAMVITMALMPPFMRLAVRWNFVDRPAMRKVHTHPIPRIGGIAMAAGLFIAALAAVRLGRSEVAYLYAGGILLVFGALDDRFDLDYRLKFLGQALAIGVVVFGGGVMIGSITLNDRLTLPMWCAWPLTVFFLLGVTNAINLADGLDGLAGGMAFLCLGALALLSIGSGLDGPSGLALAAAGAILGFLRYNTYPARVFMGDAGSQLLGLTVGVLAILATQSAATAVSTAVPLLLAGVPILDTLCVMTQRLIDRRHLFNADKNHIHHKLLELGFDQREAVATIYLAQILLFVAAYVLRFESDLLILSVYLAFSACVIALLQLAPRRGWRLRRGTASKGSPLAHLATLLRQPKALPHWSLMAVALGLITYAILIVAQTHRVNSDFVPLLRGLLLASIFALLALRSKSLSLLDKAVLYVLAVVVVYLDSTSGLEPRWFHSLDWIVPLALAVATALRLRFSADRRFQLTPLDLLVVFVALVVPNLPGMITLPPGAPLGIAKIMVLFYGIETLVGGGDQEALWIRIGTVTVLLGLAFRPLIPEL